VSRNGAFARSGAAAGPSQRVATTACGDSSVDSPPGQSSGPHEAGLV